MLRPGEHRRLAHEAERSLRSARLVKLFDLGPERFLFRFKTEDGETRHLLAALDGPWPRVMLQDERLEVPRKPSPFAELLRRQLKNARLDSFGLQGEDRVLRLRARVATKEGPAERSVVFELLPRFRNLLVLDEHERIRALLREQSEPRSLRVGEDYLPPDAAKSPDGSGDPLFAFLEGEDAESSESLSARFEAWIAPREFEGALDEERRDLLQRLKKQLQKEERLEGKLRRDLESTGRAERLRWQGELLKSVLGQVKRGQTEVAARDYTTGEEVLLPLDPKLSPRDNVENFFRRARKAERGAPILEGRLAECGERLDAVRTLIAEVEGAEGSQEIQKLEARAIAAGTLPRPRPAAEAPRKKGSKPEARQPYRRYWSKNGWEILVGRTARDNDELTFKIARGNDFWFHVAGSPGSHVIARGKGEISPDTLLDAAMLALKASKAGKSGGKHEVSWTQRKWVSKFRGANTGQVQLARRKSLLVRLDEERLQALRDRPEPKGDQDS